MTQKIYVLVADGTIDQICEDEASKNREVRDLKKMGCEVKVKCFPTWTLANQYVDKMEAR